VVGSVGRCRRGELHERVVVGSGQGTTCTAGVNDSAWLEQKRVDLDVRDRAVLDASRYGEQLA